MRSILHESEGERGKDHWKMEKVKNAFLRGLGGGETENGGLKGLLRRKEKAGKKMVFVEDDP